MDILRLIREKEKNRKKIEELSEENRRLTELISSRYMEYLEGKFSKPDEWFVCVYWANSYEFFHLGKFKYFSFLGQRGKKRLANYGNDYEAHFEFMDGFTTDLVSIARNGLDIKIEKEDAKFEIDSGIQDGVVRFNRNGIGQISKEVFEKEKAKILGEIEKLKRGTFREYKCGDVIEYANKRGIFSGKIVMIKGKSGYLEDGTKVNIGTPRVRKK